MTQDAYDSGTISALRQVVDAVYGPDGPVVVHMIIGPALSSEAPAVASLVQSFGLVCISPSAAAPLLDDRTRYRNFFRTIVSDSAFKHALLALLRSFQWQHAVVTYHNRKFDNNVGQATVSWSTFHLVNY